MSRPKIVHLASTHHPFDTRVFHKECKSLVQAGYDVTFIVPHTHDEVVDGVKIKAVPLPENGRDRLTKTVWNVYRAALQEERGSIFHFHDFELIIPAFLLKLQGNPVVYDAHEDTPLQMLYQHWIPQRLRQPVSWVSNLLESIGDRVFNGIIAAEPGIAESFSSNKNKVLIHNYPILEELTPERPIPYAERSAEVVYVGTISRVRCIEEMVDAMGRLPEALEPRLVLGGTFHPSSLLEEMQEMNGWKRVDYQGRLSRQQVANKMKTARVGLALLKPVRKYLEAYPTKLFEYMSVGIPVVASDFPQIRQFVEKAECGILVDPNDPAAITEAIQWLLEHPAEAEAMGERGREAVEQFYNWEMEAQKLIAFYDNLQHVAATPRE